MKKLIGFTVACLMFVSIVSPAFATFTETSALQMTEEINTDEGVTRYREYFEVKRRTEYWKDEPYSEITNTLICYLDKGDTLYYYSRHVDYQGNAWWYCKILTCAAAPNLRGAYGYISANDVESVVES